MKVEITNDLLWHISRMTDYLEHDEYRSYLEDPCKDHIFLDVEATRKWLDDIDIVSLNENEVELNTEEGETVESD